MIIVIKHLLCAPIISCVAAHTFLFIHSLDLHLLVVLIDVLVNPRMYIQDSTKKFMIIFQIEKKQIGLYIRHVICRDGYLDQSHQSYLNTGRGYM